MVTVVVDCVVDALLFELRGVFEGPEDEPNNMYESEMSATTPSAMAAISLLRSAGVLPSNKFISYLTSLRLSRLILRGRALFGCGATEIGRQVQT